MRTIKYLCLSLFFSFCALPLYAAQSQTSLDLSKTLNAVKSMQASFTQKVYDNKGKIAQESHGTMAMVRPGKFRWDVTKPIPQLIIANQQKLWVYDPDLEQVTIRSLNNATANNPALLLSHDNVVIEKDYVVTKLNKSAAMDWFKLVPRNPSNMFESIEMGFAHNVIQEMHLLDHLGHTTIVQFDHAQLNKSIAENVFTFKPPANVDVINEAARKS